MQVYNDHKAGTNSAAFPGKISAAVLLPLLCALTISTGSVQAQPAGSGPLHEQYAGKYGHFGYRNTNDVNRDGYVSDNIYGVENLAYYGDWDSNRILIFDIDNMRLLTIV